VLMVQTQLKKINPVVSAEVDLEGNEVNPWPYLYSIMQCKLCFPRETKLACRCKVYTCFVTLVVKIKL